MSMQRLRRARVEVELVIIACEELNFVWQPEKVRVFREMWRDGADIRVIAKCLKRKPEEVAILVMDQAKRGNIQKRPTGIFGI